MLFQTLFFIITILLCVTPIQITQPGKDDPWDPSGPLEIKWTSVETDPSSFSIQLYSPDKPNDPIDVAKDIATSDETHTYTPGSPPAKGKGWQLNFVSVVSEGRQNTGILAQSGYFEVTSDGSSASSGSGSSGGESSSNDTLSTSDSDSNYPTSKVRPSSTGTAVPMETSNSTSTFKTAVANATSSVVAATSSTPISTASPATTASATSATPAPSASSASAVHIVPRAFAVLLVSAVAFLI